jgi:hypothetical protein
VALTSDALVLRGLESGPQELGFGVLRSPLADVDPSVLVIDLERPGAIEEVASWRERYPDALIAGHLASPRRELWLQAESAGCDIVTSRFALASQVWRKLAK